MSGKSKRGDSGGGKSRGNGKALSDPRIERLLPFSFKEEDVQEIASHLPQLHKDIEEAVQKVRRKLDLREMLGEIAKNYVKPSKMRTNPCFMYVEAYALLLVDGLPDSAKRRVGMEEFAKEFPEFAVENVFEQRKLHELRNLLYVAFLYIPAENNRGHLLELCTRILEGFDIKYVTGTGATQATKNRIAIYEKLAEKDENDLYHYNTLVKIIQELTPATIENIERQLGGIRQEDSGAVTVVGDDASICILPNRNEISMSRSRDIYAEPSLSSDDWNSLLWDFDVTSSVSFMQCLSIGGNGNIFETKTVSIGAPKSTDLGSANQLTRRPSHFTSQRLASDYKNSLSVDSTPSKVNDTETSKSLKRQRIEKATVDIVEVLKRAAKAFQIENVEKFRTITERVGDLFAIIERKLTPKEAHQELLRFANNVGVDPDIPIRKNDELLLIEACMIEYVSEIGIFNDEFKDMAGLMALFPEFSARDEEEKQKLLNWYNKMTIALRVMPAEGNKGCILKLFARLLEGPRVEYILGQGAKQGTKDRIRIYEELGKIVPIKLHRPKKEKVQSRVSGLKPTESIPEYFDPCNVDESSETFEDILSIMEMSSKEADMNTVVKRLSSLSGADPANIRRSVKRDGHFDILTAEADVGNYLVSNKLLFRTFSNALEITDEDDTLTLPVEVSNHFSITQIWDPSVNAEQPSFSAFDGNFSSDAISTNPSKTVTFSKEATKEESVLIRTISVSRHHPDYEDIFDFCDPDDLSMHRTISKSIHRKDSL